MESTKLRARCKIVRLKNGEDMVMFEAGDFGTVTQNLPSINAFDIRNERTGIIYRLGKSTLQNFDQESIFNEHSLSSSFNLHGTMTGRIQSEFPNECARPQTIEQNFIKDMSDPSQYLTFLKNELDNAKYLDGTYVGAYGSRQITLSVHACDMILKAINELESRATQKFPSGKHGGDLKDIRDRTIFEAIEDGIKRGEIKNALEGAKLLERAFPLSWRTITTIHSEQVLKVEWGKAEPYGRFTRNPNLK